MWSYYGGKSKICKRYPSPKFSTIIEPFAGAAWYSVLHKDKNVLLNEKYKVVYDIWDWLINSATEEEIIKYKDFYLGQDIREINLPQPHKDLLGFCINRGTTHPCHIVQKWSCQSKFKPNYASTTEFSIKRIVQTLPYIRHWEITCGDYTNLPDIEATWFIDPPYQYGGVFYKENNIDYQELKEFVLSRKGQIIVCENSKANWLDFVPLVKLQGQKHKTEECMFYRETT